MDLALLLVIAAVFIGIGLFKGQRAQAQDDGSKTKEAPKAPSPSPAPRDPAVDDAFKPLASPDIRITPTERGMQVENTGEAPVLAQLTSPGRDSVHQSILGGASSDLSLSYPTIVKLTDPVNEREYSVAYTPPRKEGLSIGRDFTDLMPRNVTPRFVSLVGSRNNINLGSASRGQLGDEDGDGNPDNCFYSFQFEQKDYTVFGGGVSFDVGPVRISIDGFYGEWKGEATLRTFCQETVNTVSGPLVTVTRNTNERVDIEGFVQGIQANIFWPLFVYNAGGFELAIGPTAGMMWLMEVVDKVDGDEFQHIIRRESTGNLGGIASARFIVSQVISITLETGATYTFGDISGIRFNFGAGVTVNLP
jgi:hypothetical protein